MGSVEKVRFSLTLPKELYDNVEKFSKKRFMNRSTWIVQAIKIVSDMEKNNDINLE